jgi:hypothetical protein
MRSAYDEVMTTGTRRQHEPPRILGDRILAIQKPRLMIMRRQAEPRSLGLRNPDQLRPASAHDVQEEDPFARRSRVPIRAD